MATTEERTVHHLRDPQVTGEDRAAYRVDIGRHVGVATIDHILDPADPSTYRSTTTAHSGEPGGVVVAIEQTFLRADGWIRAATYCATTTDGDRLVSREEGHFSDTRHLQFGGRIAPYPADIVPLAGGLTMLRGLDFRPGKRLVVNIWLGFSVSWPVEVKVARRSQVTTPAGDFRAWEVKIRPSFSKINGMLDQVVAGILPEFQLYFDVDSPHRMVRMKFPTSPFPWDPKGTLELVEVEGAS